MAAAVPYPIIISGVIRAVNAATSLLGGGGKIAGYKADGNTAS